MNRQGAKDAKRNERTFGVRTFRVGKASSRFGLAPEGIFPSWRSWRLGGSNDIHDLPATKPEQP